MAWYGNIMYDSHTMSLQPSNVYSLCWSPPEAEGVAGGVLPACGGAGLHVPRLPPLPGVVPRARPLQGPALWEGVRGVQGGPVGLVKHTVHGVPLTSTPASGRVVTAAQAVCNTPVSVTPQYGQMDVYFLFVFPYLLFVVFVYPY